MPKPMRQDAPDLQDTRKSGFGRLKQAQSAPAVLLGRVRLTRSDDRPRKLWSLSTQRRGKNQGPSKVKVLRVQTPAMQGPNPP